MLIHAHKSITDLSWAILLWNTKECVAPKVSGQDVHLAILHLVNSIKTKNFK